MPLPGSNPPTIRVLLFARYAELLGAEQFDLPAEGVETAGQVLEWVRALPGGARIADGALVAVNLRHASRSATVAAGDEVALLPPLAGG